MSRNLPNETRALIHRLFWKLDVADAFTLESGRERKFPINRIYKRLGHVDLTCIRHELHTDVWYFDPDETTPELLWPVDKTMSTRHEKSQYGWPDGTMQFTRIKTIDTRRAREMRASKFARHMIERRVCILQPDNTAYYFEEPAAWIGGRWRETQTRLSHGDVTPEFVSVESRGMLGADIHHSVSMLISMAFRDRYERKAIITNKHGFSVMLAMDVPTAQEFFKLREVPPEKRRRAALRNWVSSHIRQIDEDRQTVVREHLRNRVEFEWAGFHCEYRPSQFDEEANAQLDAKTG